MSEETREDEERLRGAGCPLDQLRAAHGEVLILEWRDKAVVARPLTVAEYELLGENQPKIGPRRAGATAVKAAALWPDAATLEGWFQRYPGLPVTWAGALVKEAGLTTEVEAKKL